MSRRTALVADLFCGAGGSSTGARRALEAAGYRMNLVAVNHWNVAIDTHSRNHPDARHYCQDVSAARPAELVPEGKLDLLMASPTCTYHSRARGGKPINDQGRMDPWAIIHWCTELRVKRLLVENVPEFIEWGPLDLRTGKPIKRRKGEYFEAWLSALKGAGFRSEWRVLNAANYGDATTRERFFLLGRSDGRRIRWPEPTHSKTGEATLLGTPQKWRAAREIIDWSIPGRSILNRKRPLSPKTLARIYAGAVKFRWPEPFLVILRQHMDAQSIDGPLPTICAGGTHIGLAEPFVFGNRENNTGKPIDGPLPGMTTATGGGIALAEPFLLNRHGDNGATRAHNLGEPMPTADCRGAGYLCEPFVANLAHSGADASRCLSADEPLQTLHAGGGSHGLVEPFILSGQSGGAPREIDQPMPGMTGRLGSALIAPYYGSGSGETCSDTAMPLPTVTTKARFGLVVPVTHGAGGPGPRSVDQPLPTMTTAKGGEFAVVMPVTHGDDRGRVRSVEEPLPTITGAHRGELAAVVAEAVTDGLTYDIRFRMLEPHELAGAMGFSDGDAAYEFCGNKTEQTKQIGNAVPVKQATALIAAIMKD